jgi:hypothetical protein
VTEPTTCPERRCRRPAAARRLGLALALGVPLALAGCGLFEDKPPPPPCPRTLILADAADAYRYVAGRGRDLVDLNYHARIRDLRSVCTYEFDKAGGGEIEVEVALLIAVERGLANTDRQAAFRYFVGVTGAGGRVLNKQTFDARVEFPGNRTQVALREPPIATTIPIRAGQDGRSFEVFVGFQLSRDELQENRRRRPAGG